MDVGKSLHRQWCDWFQSVGGHYASKCPQRILASQHDPAGCSMCSLILRPWHELYEETREVFRLLEGQGLGFRVGEFVEGGG